MDDSPLLGRDIAIDLGTANTLVYVRGRGIVLYEPSVVAIDVEDGRPRRRRRGQAHDRPHPRLHPRHPPAQGRRHRRLRGQPSRCCATSSARSTSGASPSPRIVICVPSGVTGVEKRAVEEAAESAGARQAYIIEEPMAAAIGAGLPVDEPTGNMIVDIGGGTTEVAVISLGGIVDQQSIRVAGDELDEAIIATSRRSTTCSRRAHRRGDQDRDRLGPSARRGAAPRSAGRDLVTGPAQDHRHLDRGDPRGHRRAGAGHRRRRQGRPSTRRRRSSPPTSWTGASSWPAAARCCRGLAARLDYETSMPIVIADDPLNCVALGSGMCLEELDVFARMLKTSPSR